LNPIDLRHVLHMNPELAYQEYQTQKILKDWIAKLGYQRIYEVSTGLVIEQKDFDDEEFVLVRADMDALPIEEKTGWRYSSHNSNMHACGHDFHMATLFGLMKKVVERKTKGNFLFVFQPAEETGGGSLRIIEFLEKKDYEVKAAVAMHVTDEYNSGVIASRAGKLFASSCEVDLFFKGKAVHAAFNHLGKDAIRSAVLFLNEIYDKSWGEDNLVWFGKINGGNARNIVADHLELEGTIRSPDLRKSEEIFEILKKISKRIEKSTGVEIQIAKGSVYRQVEVNEELLKILKDSVEELGFHFLECEMKLTGEDFGYFSNKYPSLMFWFGCRKDSKAYGLHNPKFLPDDDLIEPATEIFHRLLLKLTKE